MAKEAVAAEGMTLGYASASSGSYTTIGQVVSIKPPGVQNEKIKQTHLASTIQQFRGGRIPEITEAEFTIQLDVSDTTDLDLIALAASAAKKWWKITHTGDSGTTHATDVFQGYIQQYDPDTDEDAKDEIATFTIVPTSTVTRTPKS
jgi:hypothetical protein